MVYPRPLPRHAALFLPCVCRRSYLCSLTSLPTLLPPYLPTVLPSCHRRSPLCSVHPSCADSPTSALRRSDPHARRRYRLRGCAAAARPRDHSAAAVHALRGGVPSNPPSYFLRSYLPIIRPSYRLSIPFVLHALREVCIIRPAGAPIPIRIACACAGAPSQGRAATVQNTLPQPPPSVKHLVSRLVPWSLSDFPLLLGSLPRPTPHANAPSTQRVQPAPSYLGMQAPSGRPCAARMAGHTVYRLCGA